MEIKARRETESRVAPVDEVVPVVKRKIADLETELSPGASIASEPDERLTRA